MALVARVFCGVLHQALRIEYCVFLAGPDGPAQWRLEY
jgi:hypothetical protein